MDIQYDKNLELDWKECFEWIKRCGFLKSNNSIGNNNSALYLLFEMITGILPLNILQRLSDMKIDLNKYREYTSNPKESQFHCVKNLKLFNKLALDFFDIYDTDIVAAENVYYGREFGKFILLLSKISKSKFSTASGVLGFPSENHKINAEHDYYNLLGELAVKSDICMRRICDADYDGDKNNPSARNVYESLVEHRYSDDLNASVNKTQREMCIDEIVQSEKNYVESLEILVKGYKVPMSGYMSTDELETIFKYIEDLYVIHTHFYTNIRLMVLPKGVNITLSKKLHDVFIESKQSMLIYGQYCGNIQIARNLLQDMMKTNSVKRAQIERCQEFSDKFRQFALADLLTLPIQRVLKYHLLLQVLLKCTDESHEDFVGLKSAHESMIDLSQFVNDVKRDQEVIISIDKIQSEMLQIHLPKGKKLSDYGRSQKDGELKVQLECDQKPRLRHVFIFDKMILIAHKKYAFYLQDKPPEEANTQPRRPEKLYPFKICVGEKKDEMKSLILFPKSEEMRNQWIAVVNIAIGNQYPAGSRSNGYCFVMMTFKKYEMCDFCTKLLSGAFYQGYLCKNTGKVSHKSCIPSPQSQPQSESGDPFDLKPFALETCRQDANDPNMNNFFFNENIEYRRKCRLPSEPSRDPFNMATFIDIPKSNKEKPQQRIESYENEPWYVVEIKREEANNLLENSATGTFLIRVSTNQRRAGEYSLSVRDNVPKHMKIQRNNFNNTYFLEDANTFCNLRDLVKYYSKTCLNEYFDKLKVGNLKLTIPMKKALPPTMSV